MCPEVRGFCTASGCPPKIPTQIGPQGVAATRLLLVRRCCTYSQHTHVVLCVHSSLILSECTDTPRGLALGHAYDTVSRCRTVC